MWDILLLKIVHWIVPIKRSEAISMHSSGLVSMKRVKSSSDIRLNMTSYKRLECLVILTFMLTSDVRDKKTFTKSFLFWIMNSHVKFHQFKVLILKYLDFSFLFLIKGILFFHKLLMLGNKTKTSFSFSFVLPSFSFFVIFLVCLFPHASLKQVETKIKWSFF